MGNRSGVAVASLGMGLMPFALLFSFSFALSSPTSLFFLRPTSLSTSSNSSSSPRTKSKDVKASVSDLLSLLGTPQQASTINSQEALELRSCFKFLVPFSPPTPTLNYSFSRRSLRSKSTPSGKRSRREEDELIWWPPAPVMDLARLAVDSGGDPGSIHRALDPSVILVPDVEESKANRCELTRTPYGRRFINEELNSYLEFLFEIIAARGPSVGLNVSLSRYDLFHGHLFLAVNTGRLGILFHAKEYPAYDKQVFPYNMGFCQIGSDVGYDESLMDLRNILWLAPLPSTGSQSWLAPGVLVVLDAHPGGIIYRDLIPEYVNIARTLYEDDFGDTVVDINYLNIGDRYEIFIC